MKIRTSILLTMGALCTGLVCSEEILNLSVKVFFKNQLEVALIEKDEGKARMLIDGWFLEDNKEDTKKIRPLLKIISKQNGRYSQDKREIAQLLIKHGMSIDAMCRKTGALRRSLEECFYDLPFAKMLVSNGVLLTGNGLGILYGWRLYTIGHTEDNINECNGLKELCFTRVKKGVKDCSLFYWINKCKKEGKISSLPKPVAELVVNNILTDAINDVCDLFNERLTVYDLNQIGNDSYSMFELMERGKKKFAGWDSENKINVDHFKAQVWQEHFKEFMQNNRGPQTHKNPQPCRDGNLIVLALNSK
jgi:hypothetical protein